MPLEPPITLERRSDSAAHSAAGSAKGRRSRSARIARAADANVVPVSPSPTFASRASSSACLSRSVSQIRSTILRRAGWLDRSCDGRPWRTVDGVCASKRSASGSGTGATIDGRRPIGQARGPTSERSALSVSGSRGSAETEKPFMSSEVIRRPGPKTSPISRVRRLHQRVGRDRHLDRWHAAKIVDEERERQRRSAASGARCERRLDLRRHRRGQGADGTERHDPRAGLTVDPEPELDLVRTDPALGGLPWDRAGREQRRRSRARRLRRARPLPSPSRAERPTRAT